MSGCDITPDTKLGAVLERWPELEEVLVGLSPRFRTLRNPLVGQVLRRVATLRQAAVAGGVPLSLLIDRVRRCAGLGGATHPESLEAARGRPQWAGEASTTRRRDARIDVDAGTHPLPFVMADLEALGAQDVYELVTPFVPAPLIDLARRKGLDSYSEAAPGDAFARTWFRRQDTGDVEAHPPP